MISRGAFPTLRSSRHDGHPSRCPAGKGSRAGQGSGRAHSVWPTHGCKRRPQSGQDAGTWLNPAPQAGHAFSSASRSIVDSAARRASSSSPSRNSDSTHCTASSARSPATASRYLVPQALVLPPGGSTISARMPFVESRRTTSRSRAKPPRMIVTGFSIVMGAGYAQRRRSRNAAGAGPARRVGAADRGSRRYRGASP